MGFKFHQWQLHSDRIIRDLDELLDIIMANRRFTTISHLQYGDHGLEAAIAAVKHAIDHQQKIALYADYDVDGTMSCVSWIWFLRAIGYENFIHYIPCRMKEGYGVNLNAISYLVEECGAQLIITMDTGITANEEAAYCRDKGVVFICTDHHKIQPQKMPDCIILNPKFHPNEQYQELCGCGITFVLLRKLAEFYQLPNHVWTDILALVGMATICDVVPLNGVNHKLVKIGVEALMRSQRPVLTKLRKACSILFAVDEKDVGFRLGPRINAVGRLEHADAVIEAFISDDPDPLIHYMEECNEQRKIIQKKIIQEAQIEAKKYQHLPILFLGGDWHPGVVGIAASKISEIFWKPTFLFHRGENLCKGSARSIAGFDVTEAMMAADSLFVKFGGHQAAGGFSFLAENEPLIREKLTDYAVFMRNSFSHLWQSSISADCELPLKFVNIGLAALLDDLRPFGFGFTEPRFIVNAEIANVRFFHDKHSGEPKHTAVFIKTPYRLEKVMFFNEVLSNFRHGSHAKFLVSATKNYYQGNVYLNLMGHDFNLN